MCYRPILVQNPSTGEFMKVPCGKCLDCLRKYQSDWSNRLYEEFKAKGCKGVFFTLTYDEQSVPKNYLVGTTILRSAPDYRFGTRTYIPLSRKYEYFSESPDEPLRELGIDVKDMIFEDIDFNCRQAPSKRTQMMGHLQRLFAEYMAVTQRPMNRSITPHPIDFENYEGEDEDYDLPLEFTDLYKVDEDTGEITEKSAYETPSAAVVDSFPIVSFNSVRKADVQLWLKRNRTRLKRKNPDADFSYFITSEYGPTTLRPHYHGILLGVTKEDVRDWFKDWQLHYGEIVRFDNLNPDKGGLSYVTKYCSKGAFEHPLCAKDFFYFRKKANSVKDVICNEYHSKHYEKCIQWFGIDAPIVDPTFHLISKGIGIDWAKKDVIKAKEFEDIAEGLYFQKDYQPVYDFDSLLEGDLSIEEILLNEVKFNEHINDYDVRRKSYDDWLSRFSERCCYKRTFRTKEGEKTFAFSLPSYWREKMFGRFLRIAYPAFLRKRNEEVYREKLGQVDTAEPPGAMAEKVLALEREEQEEIINRFNSCYDKFVKFYMKSKL